MSNTVERVGQLQATINSAVTSLTLKADIQGIIEGAILGIDLEELYVLAKAGTAITVLRAFNGSSAASHQADAIVRVNAKFTDFRLGDFVNESLEDLSGDGLFRMKSVEFTFNPTQYAYDLPANDLIDVWRVRYNVPGPTKVWYYIPKCYWDVDQDANTTDFPSGKSILLQTGGFPGHNVRVSYKAPFAPLVAVTDDVLATSGLHQEAHKLLHYGAAINALGGREVKRTFLERQPEPRRQEEVPVGAASQSMRPFLQFYAQTLRRERRRLRRRYNDQVY
jgi:hypothetical protein